MSAVFDRERHPCTWGACDRVYLSADALRSHVADHESGRIHERRPVLDCRHCRWVTDRLENLYTHSVKQHDDPSQGRAHTRGRRGRGPGIVISIGRRA